MATARYVVDSALRKLGMSQYDNKGTSSQDTVLNTIDAALSYLDINTSTDEGAAATETAKQVAEHALRLIGAIDPSEGGTTDELSDAYDELNRMIREWQADGIYLPNYTAVSADADTVNVPNSAITPIVYQLAGYLAPQYGKALSEQAISIAVKTKARLRRDPAEHMDVLNRMLHEWESSGIDLGFSEYSATSDKMNVPKTAIPAIIHNLVIRLAPVYEREPPQLILELGQAEKLRLQRDEADDREALNDMLLDWEADGINLGFKPVGSLSQTLRVPDNALNAVIYNLAVTLAPDYQVEPSGLVIQRARQGKQRLERDSAAQLVMSVGHLPSSRRRGFNIDSID